MSRVFTEAAIDRLQKFLADNKQEPEIQILTPDASTREYFRVTWNEKPAIACVYAESFRAAEHSYLDVTTLFLANGLPVAEVYEFDENSGIVIQEDFGDSILRDSLHQSGDRARDEFLNRAIALIAKIQSATTSAVERNSIASRLRFDEEKLLWELNFFKTHYFETYRKAELSETDAGNLDAEFNELARTLAGRANVLCHRDFHAANLMLDRENRLLIIDHQDARIGAASYDLVSLLLDRITEIPADEWLAEKKNLFLAEREKLGLAKIEARDFDEEFQKQTIQRCLKAVGTFSFQSVNRGKTYFIPYIQPMLKITLNAARKLDEFPYLQKIITQEILKNV